MSQAPHVHYHLETIGSVTVVHFNDHKIVSEVSDQLYALVEVAGHRQILLNFSRLTVLSSIAIAKLISLQKKVAGLQGRLKVCCVNPNLLELLRYVGLDRYIEIYETQEDALRTF
jgi:anti-sigma B factor antagonist